MAIIVRPNFYIPGTVIRSAEVNDDFDTIYNEFNGNINQANLTTLTGTVTWNITTNVNAISLTSSGTQPIVQFTNNGPANTKDLNGTAGVWWIDKEGDATFNNLTINGTATGGGFNAFIRKTNSANDVVDPVGAQDVATKNYVDTNTITPAAGDARYLKLDASNDPLTGVLACGTSDVLSASNNKIIRIADPTNNQDAATKAYVDSNAGISQVAADARYLKLDASNDPLTGILACGTSDTVSASNNRIIRIADPVNDQDAATKQYVDDEVATASGIKAWASVDGSGGGAPTFHAEAGFNTVTFNPAAFEGYYELTMSSAAPATTEYAIVVTPKYANLMIATARQISSTVFRIYFYPTAGPTTIGVVIDQFWVMVTY